MIDLHASSTVGSQFFRMGDVEDSSVRPLHSVRYLCLQSAHTDGHAHAAMDQDIAFWTSTGHGLGVKDKIARREYVVARIFGVSLPVMAGFLPNLPL